MRENTKESPSRLALRAYVVLRRERNTTKAAMLLREALKRAEVVHPLQRVLAASASREQIDSALDRLLAAISLDDVGANSELEGALLDELRARKRANELM